MATDSMYANPTGPARQMPGAGPTNGGGEKIDLHVHTLYSDDGEFPVAEILRRCQGAGATYLAIADHNTVRALPEALTLAPQFGVVAISGVELDCTYAGHNLHLLGYHFDDTMPIFAEIEADILGQEQRAAAQKIAQIEQVTGIPLPPEALATATNGSGITGEQIAEIYLARTDTPQHEILRPYLPGGKRADNPFVNFYWDYFSQGKPAYQPIRYISLEAAVALLHRAGGIAVLAHPGQNLQGDDALLAQIAATGIDGIEAYSSYHSEAEAAHFDAFAQAHGLLVTCGSDFHGKTKPAISLCGHHGDAATPRILSALKAAGVLPALAGN
ncbi:MAG: PHP domain-containing protein [Gemmiger sp.]|nr:PHP domain-containing protein [Gemmiger sp.]